MFALVTDDERRKYKADWVRKWRAENPEKARAKWRKDRLKHAEKRRESARQRAARWRNENLERARESSREQYAKNRAARLEKQRLYHLENIEAEQERAREWRANNKERIRELQRKYRLAHAEELRADSRERARKLRADQPEIRRQHQRNWRARHPEQVRADSNNRRAHKIPAPGRHTPEDIARLYEQQGGECAGCGSALSKSGKNKYHVDHIVPLNPRDGGQRGSNGPENLQLLCRPCNQSKNNMDPSQWEKRRKR